MRRTRRGAGPELSSKTAMSTIGIVSRSRPRLRVYRLRTSASGMLCPPKATRPRIRSRCKSTEESATYTSKVRDPASLVLSIKAIGVLPASVVSNRNDLCASTRSLQSAMASRPAAKLPPPEAASFFSMASGSTIGQSSPSRSADVSVLLPAPFVPATTISLEVSSGVGHNLAHRDFLSLHGLTGLESHFKAPTVGMLFDVLPLFVYVNDRLAGCKGRFARKATGSIQSLVHTAENVVERHRIHYRKIAGPTDCCASPRP